VNLSWEQGSATEGSPLELHWVEQGGPAAEKPSETGFGSFITGRALEAETGGKIDTVFGPDGYEWHLKMPQQTEEQAVE
jgi:two-component sensor histidine kinase